MLALALQTADDHLGGAGRLQLARRHLVPLHGIHLGDVQIAVAQPDAGAAAFAKGLLHVEVPVAFGVAQSDHAAAFFRSALQRDVDDRHSAPPPYAAPRRGRPRPPARRNPAGSVMPPLSGSQAGGALSSHYRIRQRAIRAQTDSIVSSRTFSHASTLWPRTPGAVFALMRTPFFSGLEAERGQKNENSDWAGPC